MRTTQDERQKLEVGNKPKFRDLGEISMDKFVGGENPTPLFIAHLMVPGYLP